MNKLLKKLTREVENFKKKDKVSFGHRTPAYRRNAFREGALAVAARKRLFAIDWRKRAIAAEVDAVRDVVLLTTNRYADDVKFKVFSKDGVDVLAVATTKGENFADRIIEADRLEGNIETYVENNSAIYKGVRKYETDRELFERLYSKK